MSLSVSCSVVPPTTVAVIAKNFAIYILCLFFSSCANESSNVTENPAPPVNINRQTFSANLPVRFVTPTDDVGTRLLKDYGAVFVAQGGSVRPDVVVFSDEAEVLAFQTTAGFVRETMAGVSIELQPAAMGQLKLAVSAAEASGLTITPRGTDSARRSYQNTVELWASRVEPALDHWTQLKRLSPPDAERIRRLSPFEQVPEIFKLEAEGIYFSKDLSKSIVYSVAPPGSSQHLSMLALDVAEHADPEVRAVLARHGWFQTVVSDLPHFTFLGVSDAELPGLGLKRVDNGERVFWIPAI